MDAQKYVNQYGGKAGGWYYLKDYGGLDKHLLPLVYLPRDQDISVVLEKFPERFERQIVRGTHPNDHEGLVDVLKTKKDVRDKDHLKWAMEEIREHALSNAVCSYNQYEEKDYDGKLAIMIQPQNPSLNRGSIVENPHERGTYLIDFVDESYPELDIKRVIVIGDSIVNKEPRWPPTKERVREVVKLYKRVRESGFISDRQSFQMEFGLNSSFRDKHEILFYQARPFMSFENASFRLDKKFLEYDCFGITPEKGLVLDVVRTENGEGLNSMKQPFAMIVDNMSCSMSPLVQPRNLVAFLPIGNRVNSLEHNTYRWLRKAKVSLLSYSNEFKLARIKTGDKLKIMCDGLNYDFQKVE